MKNIILVSDMMDNEYPLPDFFDKEKIATPNFDEEIDSAITNYLTNLNNKEISSITLPVNLSQNFLELSGIRVGHHIRLTKELKYRKVPLIFYGSLELETLAKISPLSSILFTPNVYYVNISRYSFEDIVKYINAISLSLNDFDFNKYLDFVRIEPPANYQSHHSVDNEIALIEWSKYLRCDNQIVEVKENLKNGLYFKYHSVLNPVESPETGTQFEITEKGNILLIDDEWEKGWKDFYNYFFHYSGQIWLDTLSIDFKSLSQTEIIQEAKNKIETFKPDVILLDLRLCDIDFEDELPSNKLTGIQILDIVKNINKGIQVIITTASNKVWNFEAAKKYGANGYIIKSGISNIKEDIKNLKTLIEEGLKRSSFLKIINQKLKAAIQCWDNYKIHQRRNLTDQMHDTLWHANLKLQIKDFLNNAFDTINNDEIQERFTISILLLYRVIEMLNEFFIVEEGTYFKKDISYKFDIDDQPVPRISFNTGNYNIETLSKGKTLSTKEKAYAIYHKYKNVTPKDLFKMINNLTEYRNKVAIHPDKRFKEESLEYLFENKFDDFKRIIVNHFNAVMNYVNSFN
ncbi:MAG: response regulator [Saprospiraceae bacterium]|nr:response regulator [Saprospiraceae bacterium]HCN38083.1 hypothetical protein [Bacteroidota bacterium]HNI02621.1 response regulator [Chitinophagales bacterium]MCB0591665.1 response regulator [Saprospiraceae bacterium]MCO5283839.1 response regulator [Saprospiraceae bacterium]